MLMTIVIENSYYKNLVVTEIFGLLTFNYEKFSKTFTPTNPKLPFRGFSRSGKPFFSIRLELNIGVANHFGLKSTYGRSKDIALG